jgi:hypothetical protein
LMVIYQQLTRIEFIFHTLMVICKQPTREKTEFLTPLKEIPDLQ